MWAFLALGQAQSPESRPKHSPLPGRAAADGFIDYSPPQYYVIAAAARSSHCCPVPNLPAQPIGAAHARRGPKRAANNPRGTPFPSLASLFLPAHKRAIPSAISLHRILLSHRSQISAGGQPIHFRAVTCRAGNFPPPPPPPPAPLPQQLAGTCSPSPSHQLSSYSTSEKSLRALSAPR